MTERAPGIVLVRHARPEIIASEPPERWGLDDRGREDCVLLAHHLRAWTLAPVVLASTEIKARQTASVLALRLGVAVLTDWRLCEVRRPPGWDPNYQASAAAYLGVGRREGWEDSDLARTRFAGAVEEALARVESGDLVVVSHGIAMTLYLSARTTIDPTTFWRELTLPDAWRLDPVSGALERCVPGFRW